MITSIWHIIYIIKRSQSAILTVPFSCMGGLVIQITPSNPRHRNVVPNNRKQ